MSNPLLESHALPPFSRILPEHVVPAIETILADSRARVAELVSQTTPGWDSLPAVMEELDDRLNQAWSPVSHLNAVSNSEAWREAYNACLPLLSAYATEIGQNEVLCGLYRELKEGPVFTTLDQAQQQVVDNALRDFRLSGVDLPAEKKQRYAEIAERLSTLCSKFSDNVLDATQSWKLHLPDELRLGGLPDTARALLAQLARQNDLPGHAVTLDFPSYLAVMTHAEDRSLREEVYTAYVTRASEVGPDAGKFDNSALIEEILALRQEEAVLLGYESYADVSLVPKMASSVDEVVRFLGDLAVKARPYAQKDFAELQQFARERFGLEDLKPWDVTYVSEKLREEKYAISQEQLRQYFPAERVVAGMFDIVTRLFSVEIRKVQADVWHEDVGYYEILESGAVIASFYLDLYARANKRGGAWMADCRVRRVRAEGVQKPVAFLTCNFNPPVDGRPALLTHDEVTTLFHEFGHGLQHMLTRVNVAGVSGINGVAWDAVELPSQFMENWCWEPEALALLSGHVESGEPLPQDLLQKMLAAKNFQSGMQTVRQLEFGLFDMEIHRQRGLTIADVQRILNEVRARTAVIPAPAFNRFQHGFTHIFAGGYAAGYYSYKWAEVLSADAFSRFEEEGIFNGATGKAFRDTVLALGGAVNAAEVFRAFRGREPSVEALLRHSGMADAA